MNLRHFLSVADFERHTRGYLPRAVHGYVHGGTEDCKTLHANANALNDYQFVPKGLVGVGNRDQSVELFGVRHTSPIGIAPIGLAAMCRHRCDQILAQSARQAGIPFVLSGMSTQAMEEVAAMAPGFWYQGYLPGDPARIAPLMDRLERAGVTVFVITIDTPVPANRENNERAGFTAPFRPSWSLFVDGVLHPRWSWQVFARTLLQDREIPRFRNITADRSGFRMVDEGGADFRKGRDLLDWSHVSWIRDRWKGRLVLKGLAHPDDAIKAVRTGVDAIIVSNHGGRQLDAAVSSIDALRGVVQAVPADYPVMVDGGFRRGTDVLKAIALGARMVFLGRPMAYGATVAGSKGVARVIDIFRSEIDRDMALLGCRTMSDLDHSFLAHGGRPFTIQKVQEDTASPVSA